jgi:hypothetical protein
LPASADFATRPFGEVMYGRTDNGTTRTHVGLDNTAIRGLVSYGDTTWAYK